MKKNHVWVIEVQEKKGGPFIPTLEVALTKRDAKNKLLLEWMPDQYLCIIASRVTKYEAVLVRK